MSLLDELGGAPESTNLVAELSPPPPKDLTPISSIRNKAAAMALMSKGDIVGNYKEGVSAIQDNNLESSKIYGDFVEGVRSDSVQGAMHILSSPDYSFEEKQRLIRSSQNKMPETSVRLAEEYLKAPSEGETPQEELVRVNTIDVLDNQVRVRQQIQGLVNAHAASLDPNTSKAFADWFASDIMPFGNSVVQGRMAKAQGKGFWNTVKGFLLPGSSRAAMQDEFFNVPTENAYATAQKFVDLVGNNAGVIFPTDNHYAQFSKLQQILSGRKAGNADAVMENLAPLLDAFGIRAEYKAGKLWLAERKAARVAASEASVSGTATVEPYTRVEATKTAPGAPDESLLTPSPSAPDQALAARRNTITQLEAEKAKLLESQNLAASGDVRKIEAELKNLRAPDTDVKTLADNIKKANPRMSSKDARIEAAKRLDEELADHNARVERLTQQLNDNREAAKTQQRIADLETQISALNKGTPEIAGSVRSPLSDAISRIEWNNLARYDNPISVGNIVGATNPARARKLFSAVMIEPTGEMAQAIYGTSKADAIAANVMPQAITESGIVTTKVPDLARELNISNEVLDRMKPTSLQFNPDEYAQADVAISKKFSEISGLTINDAMGGITLSRDGVVANVSAVYGSAEGGFLTAREALEKSLYAMKDIGGKAEDIEILAKDGMTHKPVSLSEVGDTPGEYYVRLKMPYETKINDIANVSNEDVKWNFFDNFRLLMGNRYTGSLTRNAVDVASMFTKRFSSAAIRTSDKASGLNKVLIEEVKEFTDQFTALPKARQQKVERYLKEANAAGLKDNVAKLVADGFSPQELDAIKAFRQFHNTTYYLENSDFVRTLNTEGFKILVHPTERFIAKELPSNRWSEVGEFLDPRTGNIERFDDAMRISINNVNGQLAELRRPVTINNKTVTHIFVDNNPSSYLRTIRETDQVLSKLDGYYAVHYKAPRFVDRITMDAKGNVVRRQAVAVAGDWKTAEQFKNRQITTGSERYEVRGDVQAMSIGNDDYVDINAVRGRIAQRHRGQPLDEVGSGPAILGDGDFVLGPVDSAVRSARSIAGRVAARPMLENAKARWVAQYGEYIQEGKFGEKHFPSDIGMIGKKGIPSEKGMADARSAWEYINYLEHGYANAADIVVRQMFNTASMSLGRKGFSKAERVVGKAGEVAPMAAVKGAVFNTLVGVNFLRNLVVQTFQTTRLPAYFGVLDAKGAVTMWNRVYEYVDDLRTGAKSDFTKFVEESDLMSTVDQQNLIRGSIHNAIDHSNTVLRKGSQALHMMRQVGFDTSEQVNLLTHLAASYEKFKVAGKDLSNPVIREQAIAEARHLSGNMNFAGDFPYNQTAVSMVTQFLQAPHKYLLQYTNRALPADARARLFAWDLFFWGVPTALMSNEVAEKMFPKPEVRKTIMEGAWNYMLNQMLVKEFLQSDKEIDISSLAPADVRGFYEIYQAVVTGGSEELMTHTPAGSMFGENSKIQGAIRVWSQLFKGEQLEGDNPVTLEVALRETSKIVPMLSNAYKAKLIMEYQERRNAMGVITEEDLTTTHALFQLFGFGSKSLSDIYAVSKDLTEHTKANEDDLYKAYKHAVSIAAAVHEESMSDLNTSMHTMSMVLGPYRDIPWAQEKINGWLSRDMRGADMNTHLKLMRLSGIPDDGTIRRDIERLPNLTREQKDTYISTMQSIKSEIDKEE